MTGGNAVHLVTLAADQLQKVMSAFWIHPLHIHLVMLKFYNP